MRKLFLPVCFSFVFFAACSGDHTGIHSGGKEKNDSVISIPPPKISLPDTFTKYAGTDSLYFGEHGTVFYSGKINSVLFTLEYVNDSTAVLLTRQNGKWICCDSARVQDYAMGGYVRELDLNGDRLNDLVIIQDVTAMGGNAECIVFLFDNKNKLLKHCPDFDLPNIDYDSVHHFIRSAWWSGVTHPQEKTAWKINGEKLELIKGVRYIPDEATAGGNGELLWFTEKDGKEIILKRKKGNWEPIWRIFEKALWDSKDE